MRTKALRCGCLVLLFSLVHGCIRQLHHDQLRFANTGDFSIQVLYNPAYPDSSLEHSIVDAEIGPGGWDYVATWIDLRKLPGITLFVFDEGYFKRKGSHFARPYEYLEEDSILRRYYLTRDALDTLEWVVAYPAYPSGK